MPGWLPFLFILLLVSAPAAAQVYKWTDDNGVVHYGDRQPDGTHRQLRLEGYSEIDMSDNVRASEAISRGRRALKKSRSSQSPEVGEQAEQRKAKHAAKCQAYVDRIDWIDSRLRAGGYSVGQGNRLRAERRELSGKRAWECLRN